MSKNWLIIFGICISSRSLGQINANLLIGKDSLLSTYLSNALDTVVTGDSCFSGIYYIKFSLSKKGEPMDIDCSDSIRKTIKMQLNRLLKIFRINGIPHF